MLEFDWPIESGDDKQPPLRAGRLERPPRLAGSKQVLVTVGLVSILKLTNEQIGQK